MRVILLYQAAVDAFTGTGITIIHDGTTYLGSAIGNKNFTDQFIKDKIAVWTDEVFHLAAIAATEPHAAYAVLTHGLSSKWTYTLRTLNVVAESLEPLMQALNERLLPAITGRFTWTDAQLKWMQLPIRLGGLGFPDVAESAKHEYQASIAVTREHASAIISQHDTQATQVNYSAHQSLVTQLKIAGVTGYLASPVFGTPAPYIWHPHANYPKDIWYPHGIFGTPYTVRA